MTHTRPLEDRIRDAYLNVVEAVRPDDMRGLRLPAHRRPVTPGLLRRHAVLAPVLAAATVILTIVAAVAVPRLISDHRGTAPGPAGGASGVAPPFFVAMRDGYLEVRATATGKALAHLEAPGRSDWTAVAATADPRRFVVASTQSSIGTTGPTHLYWLMLSASGSFTGLRPFSVPVIREPLSGWIGSPLTVSSDGSTLAYVTQQPGAAWNNPRSVDAISVVRDGTVRTWTISYFAGPANLSLSADGDELGYVDYPQVSQRRSSSAWVLPTDSPSGDLTQRSHRVFTDPVAKGSQAQDEFLSADGTTMYILAAPVLPSTGTTATLSAYDVVTGTLIRRVHTWSYPRQLSDVLGITPSVTGSDALLWGLHLSSADEVSLTTGAATTFRQLPLSGGDYTGGIAW